MKSNRRFLLLLLSVVGCAVVLTLAWRGKARPDSTAASADLGPGAGLAKHGSSAGGAGTSGADREVQSRRDSKSTESGATGTAPLGQTPANAPSRAEGREGGQVLAAGQDSASKSKSAAGQIGSKISLPPGHESLAAGSTGHSLGLFFQASSVSAAAQERLLQAVESFQADGENLMRAAAEKGLNVDQVSKLRADLSNDFSKNIIDTLGPQQGRSFLDLYGASMFVPLAEDFAARCSAQGDPLPPSAVAAIAVNFSANLSNPAFGRPPVIASNGQPVRQNEAFAAAATVLTPTQLVVFKNMWSEHPYPKPPGM